MSNEHAGHTANLFQSAKWYDLSINWQARLNREVPVFRDLFGEPGELGLLDAACGTGRQLVAMAKAGYRMTGLDASPDMLAMARSHVATEGVEARFVEATMDRLSDTGDSYDGIYCIGNSLAATASPALARDSLAAMASVLRPAGRLFIQILNFKKLFAESPRVRGPRVVSHDGNEYISSRIFAFEGGLVTVTSLTFWRDGDWKQYAGTGRLYPISVEELSAWSEGAGLRIDGLHGSYGLEPFDVESSEDLILVASR